MKKIIFSITAIFLLTVFSVGVSYAFTPNPTKVEARMEAKTTITASQLSSVIARGDSMIADRLKSLQKLSDRVSADKRLSDADKTSITADITSTVAALNTLKTKIDADTDLTTARADVKSIVTSYHIYVIFEPKIRLLVTINNLQTESTTISTLSAKVQTLVTDLKNQGKDVTAAQLALTDITTQLTAINTLLAADKSLVSNVTNATTNPSSVFTQVRKDLATVRADFAKIRSDFATVRATLKLFIHVKTGEASSSAK